PLECYPLVRHCIMVTGSDPCRELTSGYIRVTPGPPTMQPILPVPDPSRTPSGRPLGRPSGSPLGLPASRLCPDCGVPLLHQSGCLVCRECGWSSWVTNALPVLDERLRGTKFVA